MRNGYKNLPDFPLEGTMGTIIARDDNNMLASKAGKFSGENKNLKGQLRRPGETINASIRSRGLHTI